MKEERIDGWQESSAAQGACRISPGQARLRVVDSPRPGRVRQRRSVVGEPIVIDLVRSEEILVGDKITSFHGEIYAFGGFVGFSSAGTAKILANKLVFSADVFNLGVVTS